MDTGRDRRYLREELLIRISSCKFVNCIEITSGLVCTETEKKSGFMPDFSVVNIYKKGE